MNTIDCIKHDLSVMEKAIGASFSSVKIFGSCSKQCVHLARDIDLAIFVENPDISSIRTSLSKVSTHIPINTRRVQLRYGGDIKPDEPELQYDIVVLDVKNPSKEFMEKSSKYLIEPEQLFSSKRGWTTANKKIKRGISATLGTLGRIKQEAYQLKHPNNSPIIAFLRP